MVDISSPIEDVPVTDKLLSVPFIVKDCVFSKLPPTTMLSVAVLLPAPLQLRL